MLLEVDTVQRLCEMVYARRGLTEASLRMLRRYNRCTLAICWLLLLVTRVDWRRELLSQSRVHRLLSMAWRRPSLQWRPSRTRWRVSS